MNLDDFLFACCVSFEAAKQAKSQAKKRRKSQKAIIVQKRENGGVARHAADGTTHSIEILAFRKPENHLKEKLLPCGGNGCN